MTILLQKYYAFGMIRESLGEEALSPSKGKRETMICLQDAIRLSKDPKAEPCLTCQGAMAMTPRDYARAAAERLALQHRRGEFDQELRAQIDDAPVCAPRANLRKRPEPRMVLPSIEEARRLQVKGKRGDFVDLKIRKRKPWRDGSSWKPLPW